MRVRTSLLVAIAAISVNANVVSVSREKALSVAKQQMGNCSFDYYVVSKWQGHRNNACD